MNFLAHLYLTKDTPELVSVGNFMADAVKGTKALELHPELIQQGIRIHRAIDSFTDTHHIFKQGTARLHANYGKFAPVIMDIFYDHLLAVRWLEYNQQSLADFSKEQYRLLTRHKLLMPDASRKWLRYIKMENLLVNYASEVKIAQVLKRMDKRTGAISGMSSAINELRVYKSMLIIEFADFMQDMQQQDFINKLKNE